MRCLGNFLLIGLGLVLLYSAVQHIENPWRFLVSLRRYDMIDGVVAPVAAACLPFIQLSIGLLLITLRLPRAASFSAFILFLVFSIAQTSVLFRALDVDCGCFPAFESPVSTSTAARAYILTFLSGASFLVFSRNPTRSVPA